MFTLADMVNCTPSNYIPHFPHFPTEIHHWGERACSLYRRERSLRWARAHLAGLPLKLLLSFELWMTMGSVTGLPSNWSQVVVLGKQICICSTRSGSSYGSISPLLMMLFGFDVIGLASAWDLISHGFEPELSTLRSVAELNLRVVVFGSSSKSPLQKCSPDPL